MAQPSIGRFVWHELIEKDTKAAAAFYGDVIGWKTQPWEEGDYVMWVSGQGPLGGVMTPKGEAAGVSPRWMAHVQVASADTTAAEAKKLGGRVVHGPTDIPKVGRFAVIADAQGASLSVFQPSTSMELHDATKPGEFCWGELMTTDHEAGLRFYAGLFGWQKLREFDMGAMGKYAIFGKDGEDIGGMFTKTKDMPMPPSWLYYTQVTDLDAAVERAKARGGKLLHGPEQVPGGARIAQLLDPQGATFALHENPR